MDKTFRESFRNASPQALVDALNGQVGNPGWVTARGFYLAALREAFLVTGLDCSGFITGGGMRLITVRLDGDKVVPVADAPTPTLEAPDAPPAGGAVDLLDRQSLIDALIRSMKWGHDERIRAFGERLGVLWPGARGAGEDGILRYFAEFDFENVECVIAWLPDDLLPARVAELESGSALTEQGGSSRVLPTVATPRLRVSGALGALLGRRLAAARARGWRSYSRRRGSSCFDGGRSGGSVARRRRRHWRSAVRTGPILGCRLCERHLNLAAAERAARTAVILRACTGDVNPFGLRERHAETGNEQHCRQDKSPRGALKHFRTPITYEGASSIVRPENRFVNRDRPN